MARYALLADYEYCTGCHSCEVACKNEKNLKTDFGGIKLSEVGPFELGNNKWEWNYYPLINSQCDLCSDRVAKNEQPACVLHCLADALTYGTLEELTGVMESKGRKMHLIIP